MHNIGKTYKVYISPHVLNTRSYSIHLTLIMRCIPVHYTMYTYAAYTFNMYCACIAHKLCDARTVYYIHTERLSFLSFLLTRVPAITFKFENYLTCALISLSLCQEEKREASSARHTDPTSFFPSTRHATLITLTDKPAAVYTRRRVHAAYNCRY